MPAFYGTWRSITVSTRTGPTSWIQPRTIYFSFILLWSSHLRLSPTEILNRLVTSFPRIQAVRNSSVNRIVICFCRSQTMKFLHMFEEFVISLHRLLRYRPWFWLRDMNTTRIKHYCSYNLQVISSPWMNQSLSVPVTTRDLSLYCHLFHPHP